MCTVLLPLGDNPIAVNKHINIKNVLMRLIPIYQFNPLNVKLSPICHLLALLGAHHIHHASGIRVKVYEQKHKQRP
jgi:hypothetical protein